MQPTKCINNKKCICKLQWVKAITNLRLSNMEVLVAVVDDVVLWTARPDETQTLKQTGDT